jgi:hypothetical protein
MPLEKLQWGPKYDNKSMFREGTSEQYKDQVREKYAAWRKATLERTDVGPLRMIDASFGRPEMVKKIINEAGDLGNDYDAQTSVEDAGLIAKSDEQGYNEDLASTPLIHIPKTNATAAKGSVSFKNALGQVFLEVANAYVKLQNRKHNAKEAKTIFDSLVMLSKYMMDPKVGLKDDKSVRLLTFLKSVSYWGIPEDQQKRRKKAGYNSIFFERDPDTGRMMLTISGKGMDFVFTPSGLLENEEAILSMLEGMYKNVSSYMSQNLTDSYEEITGVGQNGEIKSNIWPNYQTYLLSNKNFDGSPRAAEELPVSTLIRPKENEGDVNRKNIYFFTTDNVDDFSASVPATKQAAPSRPVITPGMPKVEPVASDIEAKKAEADKLTPIEQNFEDGQGGRKMQPKFAGKTTMDLILSGDRTRTTRANTDIQRMLKDYGLNKIEDLVGKVIRMTDLQGRIAYTEITKVAPFTKEYQDATWQKEGWEKEVTDKLVGQYPYAIEFKLAALESSVSPTKPSNLDNAEGRKVLEDNINAKRQEELDSLFGTYTGDEYAAKEKEINDKYDALAEKLKDVKVAKPGQFVLDGETLNIQIGNTGMMIVFTAESGVTVENTNDKIKIKPEFGDAVKVVEFVKEKGNLSQEDAIANIKKSLANSVTEYESTSKQFEQYASS